MSPEISTLYLVNLTKHTKLNEPIHNRKTVNEQITAINPALPTINPGEQDETWLDQSAVIISCNPWLDQSASIMSSLNLTAANDVLFASSENR